MSELKPCPFCGGEAELHPTYDMDTNEVDGWFVWCNNDTCECKPETGQFFTEAEAIAAWNSRAAMEYEGWFYLPKPKEGIVDYGEPEITRTENGYKVRQIVDVVDEAARKWGDDLSEYIMRRICEVWNTRTDDYEQAAEYWQRMYEQTFAERTCRDTGENEWRFVCSACGYEQNGYECWNYCPNCGARRVGE